MSKCYRCGLEEDYTDQFAVCPNLAACWKCFKEHHIPPQDEYLTPKAPERCLMCGAEWRGGHVLPGQHMKIGLRVFYECGASVSIFKDCSHPEDGCYHLLVKNCWCEHNRKVSDASAKKQEEAEAAGVQHGCVRIDPDAGPRQGGTHRVQVQVAPGA